METWLQVVITSLSTFAASGGFWAYLQHRDRSKNATTRLLMGMAYDRLIGLGMKYIDRGWVTNEEYEDYQKYFFEPYKALGGNGVAERIMTDLQHLPIVGHEKYALMFRMRHDNQEIANDVRIVTPSQPRETHAE
jgi:hypothetical protein